MDDVTAELNQSDLAVYRLAKKAPGRWLRFELLDRNGTGFETVEFYQSELGFVPIQEFFNQVRREIENVVNGEYGFKLGELFAKGEEFDIPKIGEATGEDVNKLVDENMTLIQAVLDLIQRVPDFELDIICLALGVSRRNEEYVAWVKSALAEPPYRGGLSKAEGFDIIIHFVRDNAEAVRRFFTDDLKSVLEEVKKVLGSTIAVESSDPSTGGMQSSTSSPAIQASPSMT